MNRRWNTPEPPPPRVEPPTVDTPRATVPRPPHARLRETLLEIYGLDDSSSDDAIVLAALEHAPR